MLALPRSGGGRNMESSRKKSGNTLPKVLGAGLRRRGETRDLSSSRSLSRILSLSLRESKAGGFDELDGDLGDEAEVETAGGLGGVDEKG